MSSVTICYVTCPVSLLSSVNVWNNTDLFKRYKAGCLLLQHNKCLIEEPFKEQTKPASHKNVLLNFQTLTFIVSVF